VWLGAGAILALGVIWGVRACRDSFITTSCSNIDDAIYQSPDGSHEARLINQACAYGFGVSSDDYWISVRPRAGSPGAEIRIFEAQDNQPDVVWVGRGHLVVTISHVSDVRKSLHRAEDINITYRIAERLFERNYQSELDELDRKIASEWRDRILAAPEDQKNRLKALESLERGYIKQAWKNYERFKKWARENAENGRL
jgi:hypothetical protein